jgi:hypothetical protein
MEILEFHSELLKAPALYDEAKQILTLEFQRGGKYEYLEFTPDDWAAFAASDSKGRHFLKVIKPHFACSKLPEEESTDGEKSGEQDN